MAVSGRYTAILDACVLFSRLQRDVLLSFAHADLFAARWSADIEREWSAALLNRYPDAGSKIARLRQQMRQSIPNCLVANYEHIIPNITLPDENDRHVLAAALRGNADAIVTHNVRDFPKKILNNFDIEIQTPDQFVLNQLLLHPPRALAALKEMRQRWERPSMSAQEMVCLFEKRQLSLTATHLSDFLDLI